MPLARGGGGAGAGSAGGGGHVLRRLAELPPARGVVLALDVSADRAAVGGGLWELYRVADRADGPPEYGLALGASFFAALGLAGSRPRQLTAMPSFPGDLLDGTRSHGDVLLHLAARTDRGVQRAERALLAAVPDWKVRWRTTMYRDDNHVQADRPVSRNRLGYTEGLGNPRTVAQIDGDALVRPGDGEPDWAVGGSYQVVRLIQVAVQQWATHTPEQRDRIVGRRAGGRWLDGAAADEHPNFPADPRGSTTPLDAHVRRANPAASRGTAVPLIRRGYSYAHPAADGAASDEGLVFICYQRSLTAGFTAVQHRLAGEALARYVLTTGGGYYFVPPPSVN
ncbi:Dyp-type peroxidase [Streptomyces sp. NPDC004031]